MMRRKSLLISTHNITETCLAKNCRALLQMHSVHFYGIREKVLSGSWTLTVSFILRPNIFAIWRAVQARTVNLQEINTKLERLATTDALTQVHNRYFFIQSLETEIKRFHRYHTAFSLIMFDLDYFKQVNDRYGHQKGDHILVGISRLIKNTLRDTDTLFRFDEGRNSISKADE